MLVLDKEHVKPVEGETLCVRATVPVNPLRGATVSVEVPVAPARTVTEAVPAVNVKSGGDVTVRLNWPLLVPYFVSPL
jgi:hypothetical protein